MIINYYDSPIPNLDVEYFNNCNNIPIHIHCLENIHDIDRPRLDGVHYAIKRVDDIELLKEKIRKILVDSLYGNAESLAPAGLRRGIIDYPGILDCRFSQRDRNIIYENGINPIAYNVAGNGFNIILGQLFIYKSTPYEIVSHRGEINPYFHRLENTSIIAMDYEDRILYYSTNDVIFNIKHFNCNLANIYHKTEEYSFEDFLKTINTNLYIHRNGKWFTIKDNLLIEA